MRSPMRLEKVRKSDLPLFPVVQSIFYQWKKQETRYTDRPWSLDEIRLFEDIIYAQKKHGAELRAVMDMILTRSMPEIVRYYCHWKK